jgi:hypothetical protein
MNSTRPEQELLLCIARRELDSQAQEDLRSLMRREHDWQVLFASAVKHGVAPLLHKHLSTLGAGLVRSGLLAETKRAAVENSQSVLHLTGRLLSLNKAFTENGIELAILKGVVLSQIAYGELSLRRAGDIDVLIRPRDFSKAKSLLEELGYVMVPPLTPTQLRSHLDFHCEIQFMRDDWFTIVDLHWKLSPKSFCFDLDVEAVLSRLQSVEIAGTQIPTFGTEDLILYLCMHGAKHMWHRLEWISSLNEVVSSANGIDWSALCNRAEQAHSSRMLGLGLRLTNQVFGTSIPASIFATLDPNENLLRFASEIYANIFSDSNAHTISAGLVLHNYRVMDRKRDFFASVMRALYTPTLSDFEAITLPESLNALYYAFRPLRLSKAYASSLFHRRSL